MSESMARLNDPPAPPPESIDALKRRFIRQNREFARVNSNQSQRIRNLETEISRLLAENITLREQAISSAADAERWRTSKGLGKDVLQLKDRLASKLAEVNGLVEELACLPQRAATRRSSVRSRKSASKQDLIKSPNERDWRNRQTLGGVLNAERDLQEGRLPAILEDKYFPRRTLEPAEIANLVDEVDGNKDDTESPELGPPPVAHFDISEPIAFDSNKMPKRVSGGIITEDEETLTLPISLETRRRRRTSSLLQDMSVLPDNSNDVGKSQDSNSLLRTGAKRKLDMSQLDESTPVAPADDFVFQRKSTMSSKPKPSRFTGPQNRQPDQSISGTTSPQKMLESTRKVLSSKSTNSPTKRRVASTFEKKDIDKDNFAPRVKPVHVSSTGRTQPPLHIDAPKHIDLDSLAISQQPKTPGLISTDVLSPSTVPTEPSSKPTTMTRSEIAITHSVEDVLNGSIGRGSRRARAAVSYAEPNLRDKMRRPDKKLVGAVEGLKRDLSRDISIDLPDNDYPKPATEVEDVACIKTEPALLEAESQKWRTLPMAGHAATRKEEAVSPLRDKESKQIAPIMTDRRHKRTFSEVDGSRIKDDPSRVQNELERATAKLSIYDPPTSSPIMGENKVFQPEELQNTSAETTPDTKETRHLPSKSRRHSVQPPSSNTSNMTSKGTMGTDASTNRIPSRPSSALSLREMNPLTTSKDAPSLKLKRSSSVHTLSQPQNQSRSSQNRVTSNLGSSKEDNSGDGIGNGSRTMGTRRRSMMV